MTLTFNPRRAMINTHTHTKYQIKGQLATVGTDVRTDTTDRITLRVNAVGNNARFHIGLLHPLAGNDRLTNLTLLSTCCYIRLLARGRSICCPLRMKLSSSTADEQVLHVWTFSMEFLIN